MNHLVTRRLLHRAAGIFACCLLIAGCRTREHRDASQRSNDLSGTPTNIPRLEFTRLIAHWSGYADPGYLPFVDDVKPEVVQVGFYGAHFWSLADTPFGGGYPANLPVRGHRECGDWFARLNAELHRRGVKVVGHMNVKFLVGDPESPEGPRGFFRFYRDQWDETLLGPRPVPDAMDLLEKDKTGKPISNQTYSIGGMREYWACLNNPGWREVLKAWVRCGIARGVDGFISNYFYRHDCHCEHCVTAFRRYLRERFTAGELRRRFAITNLATHPFGEIVAWHEPAQSTPLRREMLRFSQVANKQAFDEVFIRFGRSLKPDLIVAQWNHLGDFGQISGDERCLLPAGLWGRDEDYLWYSMGGPPATDVAAGVLGEGTLQARYIRGVFHDKPFTLGKYESIRIRAAIAELAANGGAPMGFYTAFEDPEARREIVRYYGFLRRHEILYRANRPHAEVLLLFPRSRVHEGDVAAVARFKQLGKRLLDAHVLFDVLPDDLDTKPPLFHQTGVPMKGLATTGDRNGRTRATFLPLPGERAGVRAGQSTNTIFTGEGPGVRAANYVAVIDPSDSKLTATNVLQQLPSDLSRFAASATVRVSASWPANANELTLHFVNYNREEPADKRNPGNGIKNEKPITAPACEVDFKLPSSFPAPASAGEGGVVPSRGSRSGPGAGRVSRVEFVTPETEQVNELEFEQAGTRVRFRVPEYLVYGVVRIQFSNLE